MKSLKFILFILIVSSITLSIFLFINISTRPKEYLVDQNNSTGEVQELKVIEEVKDTEETEDIDTHSLAEDHGNGLIKAPPINLDIDTYTNLSQFRKEASRLAKKFPDTFFTCKNTSSKLVALTFDDGP